MAFSLPFPALGIDYGTSAVCRSFLNLARPLSVLFGNFLN